MADDELDATVMLFLASRSSMTTTIHPVPDPPVHLPALIVVRVTGIGPGPCASFLRPLSNSDWIFSFYVHSCLPNPAACRLLIGR